MNGKAKKNNPNNNASGANSCPLALPSKRDGTNSSKTAEAIIPRIDIAFIIFSFKL